MYIMGNHNQGYLSLPCFFLIYSLYSRKFTRKFEIHIYSLLWTDNLPTIFCPGKLLILARPLAGPKSIPNPKTLVPRMYRTKVLGWGGAEGTGRQRQRQGKGYFNFARQPSILLAPSYLKYTSPRTVPQLSHEF